MILLLLVAFYGILGGGLAGILYPRESETREVKSLDGIWNFKLSPARDSLHGFSQKWFSQELKDLGSTIPMPVPASYNDITVNKEIRDYIGVVWYDRKFFVPKSWAEHQRVWLRFGSVCYAAQVWINGQLVVTHEIGHLPFKADITQFVQFGQENLVTVAVDNILLQTTVPQGIMIRSCISRTALTFFNYAGIDRPVLLYTTPELYVDDITVTTDIYNDTGIIYFEVDYKTTYNNEVNEAYCKVSLLDKSGREVDVTDNCTGKLIVPSAKLWWPYLMDPDPGYLYELRAEVSDIDNTVKDVYHLPVGIRTITWSNTQVLINGKPIYIRGVGKHEDSDIRGKGLDLSVIIKDYNLLKWLGVNTFRTSHYPYAEEIMDMADSLGIMVIDECPSVNTDIYTDTLRQKHLSSITELFNRDKNRPSVIMWSIANEPRSQLLVAEKYFKHIAERIKSLDKSRPIMIAISRHPNEDKAGQFLDVIAFNRYNSWYSNTGQTEIIYEEVIEEAEKWFRKHQKPVLMSEYGADAVAGLHIYPESVWSEEYQDVVLEEHFKAFDYLRARGFFIGEMIWNFADFQTAQTVGRVGGNKKGVFTRQRQPKAAAFLLRKRYHELAYELDGVEPTKVLYRYTSSVNKTIFLN